MEKEKEGLKDVIKSLNKKYDGNSVMKISEMNNASIKIFSTNCFSLDNLFGCGGLPKGRIIEIFGQESSGKTSMALFLIAQVQKQGGKAVFIDAEMSFTKEYAEKIGVKIDELYVSQPDFGEEALDIVEKTAKTGEVDIIVVDSVSSLIPKKEYEAEIEKENIALQARMMSKGLRKLTGALAKSETTVIFINQIRQKTGIFWGCLHGETKIPISKKPIKKIKKYDLVRGFDFKSEKWIDVRVVKLLNNGKTTRENFVRITTEAIDSKNGICSVAITKDHKVFTDCGWKTANSLKAGDLLQSPYKSIINGTFRDFLNGTLVGDSHITIRNKNTGAIRFQDKNKNYLNWKMKKISKFFEIKSIAKYRTTEYTSENAIYKRDVLKKERDPLHFLRNEFSWLGIALWFMDDVHYDGKNEKRHSRYILSCKRFKNRNDILLKIKNCFNQQGLDCSINVRAGSICFTRKATDVIAKNIKTFVPKCMQYKLPIKYRNNYKEFDLNNKQELTTYFVKVRSIEKIKDKTARNLTKYDLKVPKTKNFLVGSLSNGFLVHNSPNTTSGGKALKFYASVRIEVKKKKKIEKNDEVIGNHLLLCAVKNKVGFPWRTSELDLIFEKGIDLVGDLLDFAENKKVIQKVGNTYMFEKEKLGVGRDNTKKFLEEHPEMVERIKKELKDPTT